MEVPADQIFDTKGQKNKWANEYGFVDQDEMFKDIKQHYQAAYIDSDRFPVVIFFVPVTAHLVDDKTKKRLMEA